MVTKADIKGAERSIKEIQRDNKSMQKEINIGKRRIKWLRGKIRKAKKELKK